MTAVDTNIISYLLSGKQLNLPDGYIYVPYVVLAEVRAGIVCGDNPSKRNKAFDLFLSSEYVKTSPGLELAAIDCYATIYAFLRGKGKPVSPNDMWIAAECMSLGLKLLTNDNDFDNVPQVIRLKP
jgi:tRNA(fMet)-specific endonuclease VapC